MEVGSEQPVMPSREQFSVGVLKSPVHVQSTQPPPSPSPPVPVMPNMRVAYTSDGTVVYKPITTSFPSPYQGGGGGSGVTAPSGVAATGGSNGQTPVITPHGLNINMGEPLKRKRGRPRKYGPDGTMALTLSPVSHAVAGQSGSGGFSLTTTGAASSVSSASAESMKKARGKLPGLSKKQQMVALGSAGIGFTPHVITVKAGEDVSSKILSFSHHGPRAVCILSANGAISNVTLRQAATSGGTVTYEGRFEILSLSGSYLLSESGGQRSRTGGLSVSLAGPDGRVLGGGVAGQLTAASPVQVVVGSFIADGKKETKPMSPLNPTSATGNLTPGGMMAPSSSPSPGTQSESSGGPGSPPNQSTGTRNNSSQHDMLNMSWK